MRAVRRINNNVAVCEDASGMEVIAMGKGIGFGELPRELALSEIERTFYEVDANLVSGMTGVSSEVFSLAVKVADRARQELDDEFSPNLAFTLADHIAFAIRRAKENVRVRMPLACDVEQSCPGEYRIARQTLRLIERELGYHLSEDEAAGIALNLVNARMAPKEERTSEEARRDEEMLEDVTEIIENEFNVVIDRRTFAYSRYATHVMYLFDRLRRGKCLDTAVAGLLADAQEQFPQGAACAERIASHIEQSWGTPLSRDERLFLLKHVSRIV